MSTLKEHDYEWKKCKLGDCMRLRRGHDLPERLRNPGPYPVVSSSGYTGFHDEFKAKKPGVVTGRYGTLGKVFYVKEDYWPLNTTLYIEDFKNNDPRFLYYLLQTVALVQNNVAAAVPGVNRNHLHELDILCPSLHYQSVIANVLGSIDDKIDIDKKINEKIEEIGQALFQHWFVDFEFPWDFEKNEFSWDGKPYKSSGGEMIESELGEIPEGWRVASIIDPDNATIISSGVRNFDGEKIYLATADVEETQIISEDSLVTYAERPSRANMSPQANSVWFAKMTNSRKLLCFSGDNDRLQKYILSTGFAGLSVTENQLYYMWSLIQSKNFDTQKERLSEGGVQVAINNTAIQQLKVITPPSTLKNEFSSYVKSMYELVNINQVQNSKLSQTRDLLLPRLMSGKFEVPIEN